jgi:hypothetical protein
MSTGIRQIEFLARAIVNRLEDRGLVEFGDAEIGIQIVATTLEDNFSAYDQIEQEARLRLPPNPTADQVEDAMKVVAAEKGFIL